MIRLPIAFALATAAVASMATAQAQNRVEVGMLDCRGSSAAFIVGSVTQLACTFRPSAGTGPVEAYNATIRRIGVDIGLNPQVAVAWAVLAPSRQIGRGELAGTYVGAGASATVGVGVGANALVGGSNNTIALQPLSLQGQTGLNVAAGIAGLELRPGP
jgi:hypothetical protein